MEPLTLMAIAQGAGGLAQTIGGAIQRKRAEKAARAQIEKLGPDQGILDYYEQAKQRYGVSPTQTAMYKRQMQNIQRAGATGLAGARGSRARMGAASSIARSLSDATLGAEVAAEQEQNRRFGQLAGASQLAAAEKRRPEELKLQMALQKAAGGTQIANVGMSNIFNALQSVGTSQLYKDIYGSGTSATGKQFPKGYTQGLNTGMLNLFPTASSYSNVGAGVRTRTTPLVPSTPSYIRRP